jgi:hypothetical protein
MTQKTRHEWSKEALFAKAQLYASAMAENSDSESLFGLWSAFTLEMLLRATVASTSPALVADSHDWSNVLYALGGQPKRAKFVPKSASATEVISRAEELVPDFGREHANFCVGHFARRNSEVHSGNLAFENIGTSSWLPMFYSTCEVLASGCGEDLESLFGEEMAEQAAEDIAALRDDTAKSAKGAVQAHKLIWEQKTAVERAESFGQANAAALRHLGHRIPCPACRSTGLLHGKVAGVPKRTVVEDGIQERQVMKPEAFYCVACGLKITGYSKLLAVGLGDTFITTSRYDAMEYFEIDLDEHVRNMMEDDNNEYF